MFNDAFALFSRMETIELPIAQLIANWSNPKELLLVFDTRFERLIPRTSQADEDSDEEEIENSSEFVEEKAEEETAEIEEEDTFDLRVALAEFVKLIDLYSVGTLRSHSLFSSISADIFCVVITRVKTAKPLLFLTSGIKMIQSTLLKLAERRVFDAIPPSTVLDAHSSNTGALQVLRSVLGFINQLNTEFEWISKNGFLVGVSSKP